MFSQHLILKAFLTLCLFYSFLQELVDEHAQGLLGRITARLVSAAEVLGDHITRQEVLAVGSVIGTGLENNFSYFLHSYGI